MNHLPLIDPQRRFIVYWTPRCGSTTLLAWFFHAIGMGDELRTKSAHTVRREWQANARMTPEELDRIQNDPAVERVVVCRDPKDRIVSSYYLALTSDSSQWNALTSAIPDLDRARRLSFAHFIDYLEAIDLDSCDLHWRRQTAQDWYRSRLRIDRFIRVEQLESHLTKFASDYGLSGPIRSTSVTPRSDAEAPEDLAFRDLTALRQILPTDDRGRIQLPSYRSFMHPTLLPKIRDCYEADFLALGYEC